MEQKAPCVAMEADVLLHVVDIAPFDQHDPLEDIQVILNELAKYDDALLNKPRWLVFNKIDAVLPEESQVMVDHILKTLAWNGPHFQISAISKTPDNTSSAA